MQLTHIITCKLHYYYLQLTLNEQNEHFVERQAQTRSFRVCVCVHVLSCK